MTSTAPPVSEAQIISNIAEAVAPLMLFLAFLLVILIWDRLARGRRRRYVLISIVTRSNSSNTRPSFMNVESEAIAKKIGDIIEGAGLGPLKVLFFQDKPTVDLVVETTNATELASRLRALLAGLPVRISDVGRAGDLRWHAKLWRHF